jgi:hypothetical protein
MTSFAEQDRSQRTLSGGGKWEEWSKRVQVDLDEARAYAQAVYAAVDDYLSTLNDEDLNKEADLSVAGLGKMRIGDFPEHHRAAQRRARRRDRRAQGASRGAGVSVLAGES